MCAKSADPKVESRVRGRAECLQQGPAVRRQVPARGPEQVSCLHSVTRPHLLCVSRTEMSKSSSISSLHVARPRSTSLTRSQSQRLGGGRGGARGGGGGGAARSAPGQQLVRPRSSTLATSAHRDRGTYLISRDRICGYISRYSTHVQTILFLPALGDPAKLQRIVPTS